MKNCGIISYATNKTNLKGQRISKYSRKCASLLFLNIFHTIKILKKKNTEEKLPNLSIIIHLALFRRFQVRQTFLLGFVEDDLISRYHWGDLISYLPPLQCWLLLPASWKYFQHFFSLSIAFLPYFYCIFITHIHPIYAINNYNVFLRKKKNSSTWIEHLFVCYHCLQRD